MVEAYHTMHEKTLHEEVVGYLTKIYNGWHRVTCCNQLFLFIVLIICLPFIVEGIFFCSVTLLGTVVALLLGILFPFGFVFGLIEHRLVYVWIPVVLFVQIGGISDLATDLILLGKGVAIYMDGERKDSYEEDDMEERLFYVRLLMTVIAAIPGILGIFIVFKRVADVIDDIDGVPQEKRLKQSSYRGATNGCAFLLLCLLWKAFLLLVRLYILYQIVKSLFQKKKIDEATKKRVQWIELALLQDLLWSGIPLGVLTVLELFYFKKEVDFLNQQNIWELIKLVALIIDLFGANYLIYFGVLGFGPKHHSNSEEAKPLLNSGHNASSPGSPQKTAAPVKNAPPAKAPAPQKATSTPAEVPAKATAPQAQRPATTSSTAPPAKALNTTTNLPPAKTPVKSSVPVKSTQVVQKKSNIQEV